GVWGGKATHSYYSEVPAGILTFRLKNLQIAMHASMYKRAAPYNSPFLPFDSDFDDPDNYELDRSAWVDVRDDEQLSRLIRLTTRLYGDAFDYQRYLDFSAAGACLRVAVATCRERTIGVSRWAGAEVQTSWDWLGTNSLVTLLGFDGRVRQVRAASDEFNKATDAPVRATIGYLKKSDEILGAYLQQTWQPGPWFGANLGARLDLDERFGRRLSPRAAVSLKTWRGATLKAIYSEAFRAPSWQETSTATPYQIIAKDLRPETVRSAEAVL